MTRLNKFHITHQYIVSLEAHYCKDIFLQSSITADFETTVCGTFSRDLEAIAGVFKDFQSAFQFNNLTYEVFNKGNVQRITIYKLLIEANSESILTPTDLEIYWSFANPKLEDLEKHLGIQIKRETIR